MGVPLPPFPFTRSTESETNIPTDWSADVSYSVTDEVTQSSAEMQRIYDADQADRRNGDISDDRWKLIGKADAARRARTRALLDGGELHTGEDFRKAAIVFQHGDKPDDYLLAHALAIVALRRGDSGAAVMAAATLDRYLEALGRPQVFGTQFSRDGKRTSLPTSLIPDVLRVELGVPKLVLQEQQFKEAMKELRAPVK